VYRERERERERLRTCCVLRVDEYDAYIIVSFVNATLVLSIGETVEEVTDSGFLGTTPTLSCSQLGDDALVQVCHLISLSPTSRSIELKTRSCNELTSGLYSAPFWVISPSVGKPNSGTPFSVLLKQFGAQQQGISVIKLFTLVKLQP